MVVQQEMMTSIHDPASLYALAARVSGDVILSTDPRYDEARRVHNITVDRRPLAIVRATNARDVAEAVTYARVNGVPLAVRSGGHSVAKHSMIDDAIIVDLSEMKAVAIDPAAGTARVQAGATSGDIIGPAGAHGLALSTGDTSSVGIGGLATGGGVGFLARTHGLTIDSLLSAQVVTAAGEIVTASEDEHADLFWAIRGGGGNFGVVTEFTFRLAPVGMILGGVLMLPATKEVLRGYLDYSVAAPDELTTIANLMHAPPAPFVPAECVGQTALVILVCWAGDIAEGQKALAPLRALATPVAELIGPMPYAALYQITEAQAAPHASAVRMMFADTISDATLDAALAAMERATSPFSVIHFRGLGGAMARVPSDATAFAHRNRDYFVAVINAWMDPSDDGARHQGWTEGVWQQIRQDRAGVYVNFLDNEGESRVHEAYPPATYARLAEIKRRYDPENLFRHNQNIRPAR
jgi:FAD/FMN-containing dehydrogenase